MGILEPETITLFDGWVRLLFFTAGAFNLILAIESYLTNDAFYENITTHVFVTVASLWFTCELIYIPDEIFGNSTDEGGLINILRVPWSVAMGILAMMSMGVIHESDLLIDDVITWSRVPLIGLGILLAITQQILGFSSDKWAHDNDCHGWKVKRWYERTSLPPPFELLPGININMLLALLLIITPIVSIYAELVRLYSDGVTFNQQVTNASVIGIDLILLVDALLHATKFQVAPVHLFTVLVQIYVSSKASEEIGSVAYTFPLFAAIPFLLIEFVFGSAFGDYAEWLVINIRPRSMYRLTYTIAIWTGVFSLVAWTVGWYGKWITLEVENGTIVQMVLDALMYLEQSIAKFLFNLVNIVNFLTVCGRKTVDPTLSMTEAQLEASLDITDNYQDGVELGNFMMNIQPAYIEFYNGTKDKDTGVYVPDVQKQCCVCDYDTVSEIKKEQRSLEYACAASNCQGSTCPNWPNGDAECATDGFFQDIMRGEQHPTDITEILNHKHADMTCVDAPPPPPPPPLSEEEEEEIEKNEKGLAALTASAGGVKQTVTNPNSGFDRPLVVPDDDTPWHDPADNALAKDSTCETIQCAVFIAVMVAATASAFIPFVGGGIAFAVKTAAKIAFKIFRFVKKFYTKYIRLNRRRKKFRKKRRKLDKIINAVKQAKLLASKGIQASEDLLFPFLALFSLGFISFFTAFWRREDSGPARSILGGIMIGLLIANVVSMLLVRFIPKAMEAIAEALPETLIKVTVVTHTGWEWMEYGVFSSLCSALFWGLAMLLGQPEDDCSKEYSKKSASIAPTTPPPLEPQAAEMSQTLALKTPRWTGKGYHPHPMREYLCSRLVRTSNQKYTELSHRLQPKKEVRNL